MTPFAIESHGSGQLLRLGGEVTVDHVRDLQAALVAALVGSPTLRIDAQAVSRLDAAAVQVLLAAARAAAHTETVAGSAAWTHAWQRFGISDPAFSPPASLDPALP